MMEILLTIAGGIVATAVMSLGLYFIHWGGLANADMIRAIGSAVTRTEEGALLPGLIIHFSSGIIFAFIYIVFWSLWGIQSVTIYLLLGLLLGAAHGLVVSFMLLALVAEHHPLPRFQQAGVGVAFAHLIGHVVYGAVLGAISGAFGLRYDFIPILAQFPG